MTRSLHVRDTQSGRDHFLYPHEKSLVEQQRHEYVGDLTCRTENMKNIQLDR
jgi:hypothetical protein